MNLLYYGGLAALAIFLFGAGYSLVSSNADMATQIANYEHDAALKDARLTSYKRMIDRRDAAIDASECKAQIRKWVSNPDSLPKPFAPFNQLDAGRTP